MALKFAKINLGKRKQAEKLLYDIMDCLDPTGANTKKYRAMFSKMSNTEFSSFMQNMWEDDTVNFVLDIVDYERDLDLNNVEKAAKKLGIDLEEYVVMPHLNMDNVNPVVTKVPVIVGYIIYKRLQQMTQKKNSTSVKVTQRSAVTGQAVGDDKNGRKSDVENAGLITIGALNSVKEFNGFRADGIESKNFAYNEIATRGYVSLEDVEKAAGIEDRTALSTVNVLYLGMGIQTDLVDSSLLLTKTAKDIKKEKG